MNIDVHHSTLFNVRSLRLLIWSLSPLRFHIERWLYNGVLSKKSHGLMQMMLTRLHKA